MLSHRGRRFDRLEIAAGAEDPLRDDAPVFDPDRRGIGIRRSGVMEPGARYRSDFRPGAFV